MMSSRIPLHLPCAVSARGKWLTIWGVWGWGVVIIKALKNMLAKIGWGHFWGAPLGDLLL